MNSRDQSLRSAQQTLFSHARSEPAFVIWEESRDHPLARHRSERPEDFVVRLSHPDFQANPRFAPILVKLKDAHDPLLDASVALAHEQALDATLRLRHIGGWIFDWREPAELAMHLSERLTLRHPGGAARLRFQDPRVVAQLEQIFTTEQLGSLVGGVTGWWFMEEGGRPRQMRSQPPAPPGPLRVNELQWRALQRTGKVNDIIRSLRMLGMTYCGEWIRLAHAFLEQAGERGHADEQDQVAYALHALYVHPRFDTHPVVERALDAAREAQGGFRVAVAGFDEAALAGIARDLAGINNNNGKGLQTG